VIGLWGAVGNASAEYHTTLITGTGVLQVTAGPVVGDYNSDGKVDTSDYVTWRRQFGTPTIANRDPNNTGIVGQADYLSWRSHLGQLVVSGGTGSNLNSELGATVPEPTTITLLLLAVALVPASRRRNAPRPRR